jgi:hypothetical protein
MEAEPAGHEDKKPRARARAFLVSAIESAESGVRLPPMKELARRAKVSLVTMWKAIAALRAEGVLSTKKGYGTVKQQSPASSPNPPPATAGQFWQRLSATIEADVMTGRFSESQKGMSAKALLSRYGVNYRTLRKSLDDCISREIIRRTGRLYSRAVNPVLADYAVVLIFIQCDTDTLGLKHLDVELLRYLEQECMHRRMTPVFVRYLQHGGRTEFINHGTGKPLSASIGEKVYACLWLAIYDSDVTDDCCRTILSYRRPVAMLDDTAQRTLPPIMSDYPLLKSFQCMPPASGAEALAEYIIGQGHRHLAFFATRFHEEWARDRYNAALKRAAQTGGTVTLFTRGFYDAPDLWPQCDLRPLVRSCLDNADLHTKGAPAMMRLFADRVIDPFMQDASYLWLLACTMEPLFEKALANRAITAWICSDDKEALVALQFLRRRLIEVPGRISVAGFNNNIDAFKPNITSFSNDYELILKSMLDYVIAPTGGRGMSPKKTVLFRGSVVKRGSVRKI